MSEPETPLVHTDEAVPIESTSSETATVQLHRGARSSAGERSLHTRNVAGSIPAVPTVPDLIAEMLADDAWRMAVEGRFWPKVMKPMDWDACWPWQGSGSRGEEPSYGNFKIKSYASERAHRISFALYNGKSPGPLLVCHTCDNPPCVNPSHLFLGTVKDNSEDMVRKGRGAKRDQRGALNGAAKLTADNVEAIRSMILSGLTNKAIAVRFGVTHQIISKIRRGHAWGGPALTQPYKHTRKAAA